MAWMSQLYMYCEKESDQIVPAVYAHSEACDLGD
uniref:Uncharacterized protein n=1 Tax=Triticum urartu TaxID=4572 RepID=A0A8R7PQ72_TRIUA